MSKCLGVKLDGLPCFPGVHGCLFPIVLIERRDRSPRQLSLCPYPVLFFSRNLVLSSFLSRLSPLSSEIISLDMMVSIWSRGQPGKKTPTLTLSLIVYQLQSLTNKISIGILPHTHFVNCHRCLSGEILPFWVNCFDYPRPFLTFQSLNHAFQIKCPLLLETRLFWKRNASNCAIFHILWEGH